MRQTEPDRDEDQWFAQGLLIGVAISAGLCVLIGLMYLAASWLWCE